MGLIKLQWQRSELNTQTIAPLSASCPIGAGVIHRRKTYITHTGLAHDQSAVHTLVRWQKILLALLISVFGISLWLSVHTTLLVIIGLLSILYFLDTVFNLFLVLKSLSLPPELSYSSEQIMALDSSTLPVYSILCPLYKEASVLPDFVRAISSLDWPKDKLDVLLLLEENDDETIAAAKQLTLPDSFRIVIVPHSQPKTKPKACNYGLAFARGEYVVIYDAEDKPDPLQLKKAYLGFQSSPDRVVCLQAKLNYYNPHTNLLTRLFTIEYSLWFDITLPGLQSINTTIPLGGTSNHFRTAVLRTLHGWDAFNVTEDCDLGARLFKHGYRTAIIDSVTLEEANSNVGNWFRQRSRWIKGYIQTFLVHNRHPVDFIRRHGIHALIFQFIIGGKIAFMLINPLLWLTTISYFAFYSVVGPTIESLYPPLIFYMAAFSLVFGNFLFMYYYMAGVAKRGHWELVKFVYLIPLYWLMVSLASLKAWYQLVINPHYWEKTHHGLHMPFARQRLFAWPRLFRFPPAFASGGILVISAGFINFLNLVYNLFLGRQISVEQLGIMGLLSSFFYFIQVPLGALSQSVTHRSAYLLGKTHLPARSFWSHTRRLVGRYSLAAILVWLACIPLFSRLFHLGHDYFPLFAFTPVLLMGGLSAVDRGFLGGNLRFSVLAVMGLTDAIVKLVSSYIFVRTGYPSLLYLVFPLSLLLSFLLGWLVSRRYPVKAVAPVYAGKFPTKFFTTSFLISLSTVSFLTLDTILAKIFLNPTQAGVYTLLSLSGKMVYFAASLFSQFILPVVSRNDGDGKDTSGPFYKLLFISGVASLAGFVAVGAYGHLTMPLLFGSRAHQLSPYLPWYAIAMVFFSLSSAIVGYHQAKRQYSLSFISFFFSLFMPFGMLLYHQDIASLVAVLVAVSAGQLVSVLYYHLFSPRPVRISLRPIQDLLEALSPRAPADSTAPIRILVFNWRDTAHVWAGGAEVYIHELAKRWVNQGNEVTVFCGNDGKQTRNAVIDGVKIIRRGGTYLVYIWAFVYYLFRFRGRYDLVIDCENGIPFFTPWYVSTPKLLLIHHIHQDVFRKHLRWPLSQIGVMLETRLMPHVYRHQQIVTVSDSSKQAILSLGFSRPEDITVINPGIELGQFTPAQSKTSYPSFVYLGRIRPYKNIDIAVRAFAKVVQNNSQARLFIAGQGENISELIGLSESLGLQRHIRFLGRVSEDAKVGLLSKCWAMLQPSSFEGWGITVIEANACGTPVIASDVLGLRDSVIRNRTGILVPAKDVAALSQAIQSVIDLPDYRRRLSAGAMAWAKTFDWEASARLFLDVIGSLLSATDRGYAWYNKPAPLPTKQ